MFAPGDRLRNYEIGALLRTGGMGTLLLGSRHGAAGFSQPVAIKVIHPHLSHDPSFREAFVSEALLASRISHPNVVRVEELGEEQGAYFIVMEYVHGFSLAELLTTLYRRRRALKYGVAVAIAMRVADGLHAAHDMRGDDGARLDLVHRDVSPQNVLISYDGLVKLTDFGIAKATGFASGTATGSLKGKIRYMSPEQAHGRALTHASDVYSLGLVVWEMLTRRRAFTKGDELAVLDLVRKPQHVVPSTFVDGIPTALDEVVMSALAVNPADRPSSANDFKRALSRAVPAAHLVDAVLLSDLLADVMRDTDDARRAAIPEAVRGALPPTRRQSTVGDLTNAMVETVGSDEARAFAEDLSVPAPGAPESGTIATGVVARSPTSPRMWLLALVFVLAIALVVFVVRTPQPEPSTPPTEQRTGQTSPSDIDAPERSIVDSVAAPPVAAPPAATVEDSPPANKRVAPRPSRRRRPRRNKKRIEPVEAPRGPTDVDGVPMLEEPTF